MHTCEAIYGAKRGAQINAVLELAIGQPCPCKQGNPCPLMPRDEVDETPTVMLPAPRV